MSKNMDVCGKVDFEDRYSYCPICKQSGQKVNRLTVENLLKDGKHQLEDDVDYYICLSRSCNIAYFNTNKAYIPKEDINVPIWFKEESPITVCYCNNVTDQVILEHIKRGCCSTLDDIKNCTGAQSGRSCLTKNPTGR